MDRRKRKIILGGVIFSLIIFLFGLLAGDPAAIPQGLRTIYLSQDVLITDYMAIAGVAAACCNAAMVTLFSLLILALSKTPTTGYTVVVLGLMAGFSLFGKNLLNILPILAGTFLYAKLRREPFANYAPVGLLATSLAPAVSFFALSPGWGHLALGVVMGVVIGFVVPPISSYTYRIQNGMNLYNMGFACGLLALVIVPLMAALDRSPTPVLHWSTAGRWQGAVFLTVLCAACVAAGVIWGGGKKTLRAYRALLRTSGRAPSDYLVHFGPGPVLVNMGVNGLTAVAYLLLVGGDFNGPTMGAVFTIMGFSAFGKHVRNIVPIMAGVAIGGVVMVNSPSTPALQIAGLFCTTLAPISGHFGWPAGLLAGFLHSAMVMQTGTPAEGVNLYNNGFSAGLLAIVLYAVLTPLTRHRNPTVHNEDYFDALVDQPMSGEADVAEDTLDSDYPHRPTRLHLHTPEPDELSYRQALMADPDTMSYNKGYDLGFPGYDRATGCIDFPPEEWQSWYSCFIGQEPRRFYAYLARADGTFVGEVNLHRGEKPWYEMGVVIEHRHRGEGYGREGLELLLEYAFLTLGASEVRNSFEETREAAMKTHLAAGFRELRREKGVVHLSITAEEYKKRLR